MLTCNNNFYAKPVFFIYGFVLRNIMTFNLCQKEKNNFNIICKRIQQVIVYETWEETNARLHRSKLTLYVSQHIEGYLTYCKDVRFVKFDRKVI